jgi:hypothetical protein
MPCCEIYASQLGGKLSLKGMQRSLNSLQGFALLSIQNPSFSGT